MPGAQSFDFDVAVIGGGSGGYAAARTVAAAGLKTVVIEGAAEVGGLCILRGCMPTKTLLYSAEVLHLAREAGTFGIRAGLPAVDFRQVMARKSKLVDEFASYRRQQLEQGAFKFERAQARFVDPHTVTVGQGRTISAGHFVISTGSAVAPPPMPSLQEVGYLTSDDALALQELPASLIILGGGAVAVEFCQFFVRLGVEVTLIQRSEHILREMDEDAAGALEAVLRREGVQVFTKTRLLGAQREGKLRQVSFEHQGNVVHARAEQILFALGRVPNSRELGLEAIGVATKHDRIVTNPEMQTSLSHIYAAGDCTGLFEIVHLAVQQGEIAGHNIAHPAQPRQMDYRLHTSVVFTDPQVATVGMTEKAARGLGIRYLAASYPFADHGKSIIMQALDGFVKLLADPVTGEILGGGVVGPVGGELIHEIIAAMANGMTVHALASMPHYHPTLAEIWTYPAEELASQISL